MTPERVRAAGAASITGLTLRTVQHMAAQGRIPGAAKLGGVWTFDETMLRRWVRSQEKASCPTTSTDAGGRGTAALKLPDGSIGALYGQLFGRRRRNASPSGLPK